MNTKDDQQWADVDAYITYDKQATRWKYLVPRPNGLGPVKGSSDYRSEVRGIVADLIRDKGPARVVARPPWSMQRHE